MVRTEARYDADRDGYVPVNRNTLEEIEPHVQLGRHFAPVQAAVTQYAQRSKCSISLRVWSSWVVIQPIVAGCVCDRDGAFGRDGAQRLILRL